MAQTNKDKKSQLRTLKTTDITAFSDRANELALVIVVDLLKRGVTSNRKAIIAEVAYQLNVSIVTAERYVDRMCALSGPIEVCDHSLSLKWEGK